jgi:tRNA(adenine34) deaminase
MSDYLHLALEEARRALAEGEVPVGCVVVKGDEVLASTHNLTETLGDPTAHAEILAIREASSNLGGKWLEGCEVFVTLEPCVMCAYALVLARVKRVTFGSLDRRHGGVVTLYNILDDTRLNHRVKWVYEPLEECSRILEDFFRLRRDGDRRP